MQLQTLLLACVAIGLSEASYRPPVLIKQCQNGWFQYGGHCYFFVQTTATYDEAITACKRQNAYLVMVNDETEDNFLQKSVSSLIYGWSAKKANFYISARCVRTPYSYKCVWKNDNTNEPLDYTGWNSYAVQGQQQLCGVLCGKYQWSWDYYVCTSRAYYICEKPAVLRPAYQ